MCKSNNGWVAKEKDEQIGRNNSFRVKLYVVF